MEKNTVPQSKKKHSLNIRDLMDEKPKLSEVSLSPRKSDHGLQEHKFEPLIIPSIKEFKELEKQMDRQFRTFSNQMIKKLDYKWEELENRVSELEGFATNKFEQDNIKRKIDDIDCRLSYFDTYKIEQDLKIREIEKKLTK